MKAWLIIWLLAAVPLHAQNGRAQQHEQYVKYSPTPAAFLDVQPTPTPEQGSANPQQPQTLCERLIEALVSQWPIVVIGIATLFVIGYQAREMARATRAMRDSTIEVKRQADIMERQTKATETAAGAALLNAQAYIKSERPWLVVEIEPVEPLDIPVGVKLDIYRVSAKNKGRTPAEMIDGVCGQGVHPIEDQVPNEERMGPFLAPVQSLTMPGDSFQIDTISITSHPIDRTSLPVKMLYVYGRIRYWDMFTDRTREGVMPYETRWLLAYESSKKVWYRAASGYSRNT